MIPVKIDQFNKRTLSPSKKKKKTEAKENFVNYFKCSYAHLLISEQVKQLQY